MAKGPLSILGAAFPSGTGGVQPYPQALSAIVSNDLWPGLVWTFPNTGTDPLILAGSFRVPDDFASAPAFLVDWLSTPTSGNMQWNVDYRAIADGESLDPTTWQESINSGAVAVPGTLGHRKATSIAATAGNFLGGDLVLFRIYREPDLANDTAAGDIHLADLLLSYA